MNAPRTETGNATLRRSQTTRRLESDPSCAEYRFSWRLLHVTTDQPNSSSWPRSCHQIATCRCSIALWFRKATFQAAAVPWNCRRANSHSSAWPAVGDDRKAAVGQRRFPLFRTRPRDPQLPDDAGKCCGGLQIIKLPVAGTRHWPVARPEPSLTRLALSGRSGVVTGHW